MIKTKENPFEIKLLKRLGIKSYKVAMRVLYCTLIVQVQ